MRGLDTLTVRDKTRLDGCYTSMLRKVLNVTWQDRIPNEVLYGGLTPLSTKIRTRRLRLAGHCIRHDDVAPHSLVLWDPQQGRASRGGQRSTFIDTLKRDTGLHSTSEIRALMLDRSLWQATTAKFKIQNSANLLMMFILRTLFMLAVHVQTRNCFIVNNKHEKNYSILIG